MKKLFAALALALCTACATTPNPSAMVDAGYTTVNSYVDYTKQQHARGLISDAKAIEKADRADKYLARLREARKVLVGCGGQPCKEFIDIINSQDLKAELLAYERELRAKGQK